jgi:hypothetical protein
MVFAHWGSFTDMDAPFFDLEGIAILVVITPAIGGFVVVGLMIKQFGSCVLV